MAEKRKRGGLFNSVKLQKNCKFGQAVKLGKNKKDNLVNYARQLTSLGNLQLVIVRNLQRELENIDF